MCIPSLDQNGLYKAPESMHDETSIYAIEDYADKTALDAHMDLPLCKN